MCGITGWIMDQKPSEVFTLSLMSHMEKRGYQSFGFYNGETAKVTRNVGEITEILRASDLNFTNGFLHTRHATQGKIVAQNSHPFAIGDLIGAHNGIIYNHALLNIDHKRKCAVDSEHIFHHICDNKDLTELEGYAAIEYFRNNEYFIASSNTKDLYCALLENGIVWASTREAITTACFQAGYKIVHFFAIEEDHTYRVAIDNLYETNTPFKITDKLFKTDWRDFKSPLAPTDKELRGQMKSLLQRDYESAWIRDGVSRDTVPDDMPETETMRVAGPDVCDWCGEYKECLSLSDSTLACYACAEEMGELDETGDTESNPLIGEE